MTFLLSSDRLDLRPCQLSDLDALYELWTDADIRRFLFDDRTISPEEARSFIEASLTSFAKQRYGIWLFFQSQFFQPKDVTISGFAGLLETEAAPSLIVGTQPLLWQQGYGREAAMAVLRYAFDTLGLEQIVADVDEPNVASIRLLESLGMHQTGRAIVNDRPLLYYEIRNS